MDDDEDAIGTVECGQCSKTLLGEKAALAWDKVQKQRKPPFPRIAGRIRDGARMVPFCGQCVQVKRYGKERRPPEPDRYLEVAQSQWQQNAVRSMEDGGNE